ncbi:DUF4390 domain-containing protein [Methylobacter sp. S3L5C]|uniref:DUF4390 domain-containing protein n=1 Tax=Methylobacter sp. S3L5C TaxID=2839024 RepID=UPI001FAD9D0E|nr:DUF4390 domain-containing protein [Methylobacter sp. S3L5C]UOA09175.1 DUF4390 domain-containing protein [Methylobacter sp. S3L5C]
MPLLCCFIIGLLPFLSYANEFTAEVKQAEITLEGNSYVLSADIVYQLSEKAKEALQNGVPLFWDIQVKMLQHRDIVWDKTLVDTTLRYRLQYHALLNMYRVRNEGSGEVYNFSMLSAALDLMSAVRDFHVMDKAMLIPQKQYLCAMKISFDRDALPLPLRTITYIDRQWYLSSEWTLWPLKK